MVWLTKPPLGTQLDWTNTLNQGLSAFWVFNEGTGNIVNDISGNANTGTLVNMASPSTTTSGWNPGRLGPAIVFDGVNNYIDPINEISFANTDQFTISLWLKFSGSGGPLVCNNTWSPSEGFFTSIDETNVYFGTGDGVTKSSYFPIHNMVADTWYHIAFTATLTNLKIYVNGLLLGTGGTFITNIADSPWSLMIGKNSNVGANYFNSFIEEVRIHNRALIDNEIMELYTNPYGMFIDESCAELLCTLNIT